MYELSDVYLKDVIIIIVEGVYRNNYLLNHKIRRI